MKTAFMIARNVILGLLLIFAALYLWMWYFSWKQWTVKNGKDFCSNGQYSIWRAYEDEGKYFCDNTTRGRCIGGVTSFTQSENKDLFARFELWNFKGKSVDEINAMLKVDNNLGYSYNVFSNDYGKMYFAKKNGDVMRYLRLDNDTCSVQLYSEDMVSRMNEKDKAIFKGLK